LRIPTKGSDRARHQGEKTDAKLETKSLPGIAISNNAGRINANKARDERGALSTVALKVVGSVSKALPGPPVKSA